MIDTVEGARRRFAEELRAAYRLGSDALVGALAPLDEWLDAVRDGGRLHVPLTCTMAGMPASLSKGMILTATRQGRDWMARVGSMVMIYALVGARDEVMNARLGQALMGGTSGSVTCLRRDPHEPGPTCWLHGSSCLSTA